jgi:hypothetical protein
VRAVTSSNRRLCERNGHRRETVLAHASLSLFDGQRRFQRIQGEAFACGHSLDRQALIRRRDYMVDQFRKEVHSVVLLPAHRDLASLEPSDKLRDDALQFRDGMGHTFVIDKRRIR